MWRRPVLFLMLIGLGVGLLHPWIWADELGDIEKQLSELQGAYEMSVSATTPLESEVARLEKQLGIIKAGIFTAEQNLQNLEEDIAKRELDLEYQIVLLQERVRSWYINRQSYSILAVFLSRNNTVGNLTHNLVYRQAAADKDKQIILSVAEGLVQLESDKMKVEQDRQRLEVVKAGASKQSVFLQGEIAKARAYQQILSNQIAELSARQQKLLAEKTGSFTTSVGEVPLADDPASRPDYDPGFRPAFAAFSFGAPHFRGLSQYGARGRAREGQNEEQILKAYYGDVRIEIRNDLPPIISTSVGNLSLEENYLLGIAEMPSDWSENNLAALKAQVIAARSYALAYVGWRIGMGGGGGSICITENCQVYKSSKAASPPENWRRAVQETRGMILVGNPGGQVVNAFYAASSGGYQESYTSLGHTTPGLWDTVCGNQGCWTGQAYERKGESPWFYKGWYKSRSGMTCGRSHPWLTEEEIADIVNSVLVYTREQSALNHVSQVDGCLGGVPETWSRDQVRQEAAKYGGPVSNIFNVEVNYSTSGVTNRVYVSTDKGGFDFSGKDFKLIFNLRAPGVVHLKSGLFNIEKK